MQQFLSFRVEKKYIFKNLTSEQHSANSSCKTSLFFEAFRLTVTGVLQVNAKRLYLKAILWLLRGPIPI